MLAKDVKIVMDGYKITSFTVDGVDIPGVISYQINEGVDEIPTVTFKIAVTDSIELYRQR